MILLVLPTTSSLTLLVATPTLVSSLAASSNILFDNVFATHITTKNVKYLNPSCANFHTHWIRCLWPFSKELRALLDRFTRTIFEHKQDSFCRSLSSIRKYYLNHWPTICLSMPAACVTKARLVSSQRSRCKL
jgi:hypothetical protein